MRFMKKQLIRRILAGLFLAMIPLAALLGHPLWHLARTYFADNRVSRPLPKGVVDDASRLNQVKPVEIVHVGEGSALFEDQIRAVLARAKDANIPVSIAGAKHTMGGHTIHPSGAYLDMRPLKAMFVDDKTTDLLHVQAGATWE